MTTDAPEGLTRRLLEHVRQVRHHLGAGEAGLAPPRTPFAELLDSMGLVEFVLVVAEDCGTTPEAIEECVGRKFGTVAELAAAMQAAGLTGPAGPPRGSAL